MTLIQSLLRRLISQQAAAGVGTSPVALQPELLKAVSGGDGGSDRFAAQRLVISRSRRGPGPGATLAQPPKAGCDDRTLFHARAGGYAPPLRPADITIGRVFIAARPRWLKRVIAS
ncbi:MAG: hypothetical protein IPL57_13020 [Rubrivivax sp.]|nr:hypothetical protein [Rubrivivax sp.]